MTASLIRRGGAAAVVATALMSQAAEAAPRCETPRTPLDRRACAAAQQGPQALRQFIWRMRISASLDFDEYVDDATRRDWAARGLQDEQRPPDGPASATLAERR